MFGWLPWATPRTSRVDRITALQGFSIEDLEDPEASATFVAGGSETKGALPVETERLSGALYSSRGRGYARYNEDAALLLRDARGWLYAGAFDQAGGLGGTVRGQASALAARAAFEAFRELARTEDPPTDTQNLRRLERAIWSAHETLLERGEGEVTTAVLAVVGPDRALVVNSGDSGALQYSGLELVQQTRMHEADGVHGVGLLTHAVGLIPEQPEPDSYRWSLQPGDWVVLGSDGLLDAGGETHPLSPGLAHHGEPVDGLNETVGKILRRMVFMDAKPDNLTVVAIRVEDQEEGPG